MAEKKRVPVNAVETQQTESNNVRTDSTFIRMLDLEDGESILQMRKNVSLSMNVKRDFFL